MKANKRVLTTVIGTCEREYQNLHLLSCGVKPERTEVRKMIKEKLIDGKWVEYENTYLFPAETGYGSYIKDNPQLKNFIPIEGDNTLVREFCDNLEVPNGLYYI
jgi:hypothetical protein